MNTSLNPSTPYLTPNPDVIQKVLQGLLAYSNANRQIPEMIQPPLRVPPPQGNVMNAFMSDPKTQQNYSPLVLQRMSQENPTPPPSSGPVQGNYAQNSGHIRYGQLPQLPPPSPQEIQNYLSQNRITLPNGQVITLGDVNPNARPRTEAEKKANPAKVVTQEDVDANQRTKDAYKAMGMSEQSASHQTFNPPMGEEQPKKGTEQSAKPLGEDEVLPKLMEIEATISQRGMIPQQAQAARAYAMQRMMKRLPKGFDPSPLFAYAAGGTEGLQQAHREEAVQERDILRATLEWKQKEQDAINTEKRDEAKAKLQANFALKNALLQKAIPAKDWDTIKGVLGPDAVQNWGWWKSLSPTALSAGSMASPSTTQTIIDKHAQKVVDKSKTASGNK